MVVIKILTAQRGRDDMKQRILLCRGKSCRKRKKKRKVLLKALSEIAAVEEVECQDICSGPVVVVPVDNRLMWFERVDTKKARRSLQDFIAGEKLSKTLRKRMVKKQDRDRK
jgi:(2Fe-2S) ferredoxin